MTQITLNTLQTVTNEKLKSFYTDQITTSDLNRELLGDILNEASKRGLSFNGKENYWPFNK